MISFEFLFPLTRIMEMKLGTESESGQSGGLHAFCSDRLMRTAAVWSRKRVSCVGQRCSLSRHPSSAERCVECFVKMLDADGDGFFDAAELSAASELVEAARLSSRIESLLSSTKSWTAELSSGSRSTRFVRCSGRRGPPADGLCANRSSSIGVAGQRTPTHDSSGTGGGPADLETGPWTLTRLRREGREPAPDRRRSAFPFFRMPGLLPSSPFPRIVTSFLCAIGGCAVPHGLPPLAGVVVPRRGPQGGDGASRAPVAVSAAKGAASPSSSRRCLSTAQSSRCWRGSAAVNFGGSSAGRRFTHLGLAFSVFSSPTQRFTLRRSRGGARSAFSTPRGRRLGRRSQACSCC